MESIAIYMIYLESIMLEDIVPDFSCFDHPTTAEDVLYASDFNVVEIFAGLTMQAEV